MYTKQEGDEQNIWTSCGIFQLVIDQAEVIYLYTRPEFRKRGLGSSVLKFFIDDLKSRSSPNGVVHLSLEASVNNVAAIKLYENIGFQAVKRLPNYYRGNEDGMVYKLDIQTAGVDPAR